MADTDIFQAAVFLLQAQGVGEAKVGMTDHTEYVGDTPINHSLGHQVTNR